MRVELMNKDVPSMDQCLTAMALNEDVKILWDQITLHRYEYGRDAKFSALVAEYNVLSEKAAIETQKLLAAFGKDAANAQDHNQDAEVTLSGELSPSHGRGLSRSKAA